MSTSETPRHVYLQRYSVLPIAILWMGLRGESEGLPSMLATSFAEAAGVSGSPKMGIGAVKQCKGLSGYVSNGSWRAIPRKNLLPTMAHSGSLASTSNRKARCQVAFFLFFGMSHVLTYYMLLKTLGLWLTGYWKRCDFQPGAKSKPGCAAQTAMT